MSREIAPSRLRMVAETIGERFHVQPHAILSRDRAQRIAAARASMMRELFNQGFSMSAIGRAMDRDHTTVGHAIRKGAR